MAPTVLTGVSPSDRIAQEEVFGPVLSVIPFDDEAEAIEIANGVPLGLTGSVWTNNLNRAWRVVSAMEAGYTWINGSSMHFPKLPYGGVKGFGVGAREECLEELLGYTETKAITIMRRTTVMRRAPSVPTEEAMSYVIGIDTGGTFPDAFVADESGRLAASTMRR